QEEMSLARNRAMIGREFAVLVEGAARRGRGMVSGKTPQFKTAIFAGAEGVRAGDTVNVRVDSATGHSLMCSIA
ncbi:TRAM domain-containing protein, partial [Candidatus Binatus sp.]